MQPTTPGPRAKKRDVAPAPTDDEELAPEAPADEEEEGAAPPSEIAPETSDEECAAMPTTPAEERAATVSDIKSLVGSATRAGKRTERVIELGDHEVWLDLSDLSDGGKMTVLHAIRKLRREHGFPMDTGDGLLRLEKRFHVAA